MKDKQTLKLLGDLWSDVSDPNFIWQVLALVTCILVALVVARWWRKRGGESKRGALRAASSRLAFPLTGLILVAAAHAGLQPFVRVNLLKVAIPLLGSMALVRAIVYVLRRTFRQATWLVAGERWIAFLIWGWLALYITDVAPLVIDALEEVSFTVGKQSIDLWMILHGIVTVFFTVVLALWLGGVLESRLLRTEMDSSLRIVAVRVVKALLTIVAILVSLSLVGIDMTALSVFTGALGVGLGFGLQKIASNYVSGFIILLDRSIRIGNVIQVDANTGGMVSQITTRYTVLRNPIGVEFIVPNENLVSNVVQNQSYSDTRLRVATVIGVAYDTDLEVAMAIMREAAAAHPRVLAEPAPAVALQRFGDSSIDLELGFWIEDPEAGTGNVRSDINFAIWRAFRDQGVEIPFPQREVRLLNPLPSSQ